ncbi:24769_t:CDS:2, partial [Gigaspora rosea]
YLEISQRAKLLNDRCNVISDLLDMLHEDVGSYNMTCITWIIIWLIVVAVLVAISEIAVKALYFYG